MGESKDKVEIKKIVLNVGGEVIHLSLDQAKELQDLLNRTFGHDTVKTEYIPYYPYNRPYYWYNDYPKYDKWTVTCDSSFGNGAVLCSVK